MCEREKLDILLIMKIISWNVNGLRAVHRKGVIGWVFDSGADIICLQETKSLPEQLPDEIHNPVGFSSYFNFPDIKKGYSGVAIYSKKEPQNVLYGIGGKKDEEGRVIVAEYKDFFLLNVYFPNGGGGPERLAYKLDFYKRFFVYIKKLEKEKPVIFCGDVNTAHNEIDLARPKENETNTGFLPQERAWISEVIAGGYTDIFRSLFPHMRDAYTYWDMKTFARDRNVGWRIDYFFVSNGLVKKIEKAEILSDIYGSDHCPITLEGKLSL
jgi:exodeoxyribonuclease-3